MEWDVEDELEGKVEGDGGSIERWESGGYWEEDMMGVLRGGDRHKSIVIILLMML